MYKLAFIAIAISTATCHDLVLDSELVITSFRLHTAADCPEGYNIIEGTDDDDTLIGTNGDDCILGYDGDDKIFGRGGDDHLAGGNGDDKLFGQSGDDVVEGGGGSDLIRGGNGNDRLLGDDGSDNIGGNGGIDIIHGGDGDDILSGGGNGNTLYGGAGDDTIAGNQQNNIVIDNSGDAALSLELNTWPVVDSIVPNPTQITAGQTTSLALSAHDPDGDELTYFWWANCAGDFSDIDNRNPNFTLEALVADQCTLNVEVSDERGGLTTGTITIATGTSVVPEG